MIVAVNEQIFSTQIEHFRSQHDWSFSQTETFRAKQPLNPDEKQIIKSLTGKIAPRALTFRLTVNLFTIGAVWWPHNLISSIGIDVVFAYETYEHTSLRAALFFFL